MKTDEQEGAGADNPDETVSVDGSSQPPQPTTRDADADEDRQGGKATKPNAAVAKATKPERTLATGETAMAIPQQGEIEAMVPMMVLGNGGGGKDVVKPSLPKPLTKLLENTNGLTQEGNMKLGSFFQKKAPESLTHNWSSTMKKFLTELRKEGCM